MLGRFVAGQVHANYSPQRRQGVAELPVASLTRVVWFVSLEGSQSLGGMPQIRRET
jgi:hypothetical protein